MEQPSLGAEAILERLQHQQSSTRPQCPPLLVLRVLVMVTELCTEHPESGSRTRQSWCHPAPQNRPLHPPAVATAWPGRGRCWKVPDVTRPPPGQCLAGTDPLQVLVLPWHPIRTPARATTPKVFARTEILALVPFQDLPVSLSPPACPTGLCHNLEGWLLWEGSWQNQGTPKEIPDFSCAPDVSNSSQHLPGKKKKSMFGSIKAVG